MSAELRAIETSDFAAIAGECDPGGAPMLQWIAIDQLVVDDSYQRPLQNAQSRKIARAIAERFDWSKFSTVIVAPVEGGRYAIIDGQHRTTGAKLRGIESVPCQVVIADRAKQAAAFASINGTVTRMTALALYRAAVGAGEPESCQIDEIAKRVGVRILRGPTAQKDLKPGDTMAVVVVRQCLRAYGEDAVVAGLSAVTKTRHNVPGALGAGAIRGLIAAAADMPGDAEAYTPGVDRLPLAELVRNADAMRVGGVAAWSALHSRLRDRLRGRAVAPPRAEAANGSAPGPRHPLTPREREKAAEEHPIVAHKRAAHVPWGHIALQLSVSEHDLRRRHDPDYRPEAAR